MTDYTNYNYNNLSPEKIIELIKKYYSKNKSLAKTGLILRDRYLVTDVKKVLGKKLSAFVQVDLPEDVVSLAKKYHALAKHCEKAKKDNHNKRRLLLNYFHLRRAVNYNIRLNKIDSKVKVNPKWIDLINLKY